MASEYRAPDAHLYKMVYDQPHLELEPPENEIAVVQGALRALVSEGILPTSTYDLRAFRAHRDAVRKHFEIPWTAITPRMQRLLYALNAIRRPQVMIAAGCFCGNTFISNAGAAVGPGAVYRAKQLIGVEIKPEEAERAERNVRKLDRTGVARVVAADAVAFCATFQGQIDLLYLDADGDAQTGKGVYLDILHAAWDKLPEGALILAHNSVNAAERLSHYLAFVRSAANCAASVNVVIDGEGLEVSKK